jgi:hypothetical protein
MTIHLFEPDCQTEKQALELALVLDQAEIYLCNKCNCYHIRAITDAASATLADEHQ